jgi:hypothetical protein
MSENCRAIGSSMLGSARSGPNPTIRLVGEPALFHIMALLLNVGE